ncbi:hypothetical protein GCM10010219_45570 [Streptomyces netropsis]|nr:hypothetical protein GCM10010219_45570 [Streptomyces netropsis]
MGTGLSGAGAPAGVVSTRAAGTAPPVVAAVVDEGAAVRSVRAAARRCVPGSRALQRVKFTEDYLAESFRTSSAGSAASCGSAAG